MSVKPLTQTSFLVGYYGTFATLIAELLTAVFNASVRLYLIFGSLL